MKFNNITIVLIAIVMLFFYAACGGKDTSMIDIKYDPETTPSMNTDSVTTLISDSGITRYKLVTENWQVFDKAEDPFWYFPKGIYIERFDSVFQVEAKILADTAWNFTDKRLWRLKGNVDIRNMEGEMFLSDELFWDQQSQKVYSDKFIEIKRGDTELKGYGFESNQEMTEYRIFRPHDGKIPFREENEENQEDGEGNEKSLKTSSETLKLDTISKADE
ncbi:MAG: LPS export ABC transporter periplasmic protein LptC [Dysgonamonadaceae bacterium]|nr:LPS export ABC transporter periplasmic protein LptC [Dysgonamonadaceae bacterium]MDD4729049.1 LPS export ABC transporter periplasmic protein LptC [Dysgonamonadaceae bacterium]